MVRNYGITLIQSDHKKPIFFCQVCKANLWFNITIKNHRSGVQEIVSHHFFFITNLLQNKSAEPLLVRRLKKGVKYNNYYITKK